MKSYNQTIGELEREIDRIYNIAFTKMRQAEYQLKEDIIKDNYNLPDATSIITTTAVAQRQIIIIQREIEELYKTRESVQNKLRLLFDHDE